MLATGPLELLAKALCKVFVTVNLGCEALAIDRDSIVEIHDVLPIRFLAALGLRSQAA